MTLLFFMHSVIVVMNSYDKKNNLLQTN